MMDLKTSEETSLVKKFGQLAILLDLVLERRQSASPVLEVLTASSQQVGLGKSSWAKAVVLDPVEHQHGSGALVVP